MRYLSPALLALVLAACGGGSSSAPPPTLGIFTEGTTIYGVGDSLGLQATGSSWGEAVVWVSSNPNVISITPQNAVMALATGEALGTATVTASLSSGATAAITLRVFPVGGSGVESIDRAIVDFMVKYAIPGGALAVVHDNQLVVTRSYGFSDVGTGTLADPDDRVRLASVSKPIASVATMTLVESGDMALGDFVFPDHLAAIFNDPNVVHGDARFGDITISHLLRHRGGWNREIAGDPMFMARTIATAQGVQSPPGGVDIIRYMLTQPLQFAPGFEERYSNFGYCVLARAIESASGVEFESFVIDNVFVPAGIDQNRIRVGGTRAPDLLADEMSYYGRGAEGQLTQSVFDDGPAQVPWPYGGFYLRPMDGNGGWVASAPDLLQFALAVDGDPTIPDVISAASRTAIMHGYGNGTAGYGLGWYINAQGDWSHTGRLQGSWSHLSVGADGTHFAVLFNASHPGDAPTGEMEVVVTNAVRSVTNWP